MEALSIVAANVLEVAVFLGGITLCVRFDQQGKVRRRELEHAERMRAIELGRPLDALERRTRRRARGAGHVEILRPAAPRSPAGRVSLVIRRRRRDPS